jgi:ABC-type spermidine/putrescine transport system permease subunit II
MTREGRIRRRAHLGQIALWTLCGVVFVFLTFPVLIVIPISFSSASYLHFPPPGLSLRWYQSYLGNDQWLRATALSFEVGAFTSLLSVLLGIPAAIALVRGKFVGKNLLNTFLVLPLVVPTIIVAIALYSLYADLHLIGTMFGLVLAHTLLASPIVMIVVASTLNGLDQGFERAAMSLGATPYRTFLLVTLPLIQHGIWSAAVFAFVTSFDEVVIAIFISGSTAITLPRQMWDGVRTEIDPTIAAVSSLVVGTSIVVLGVVLLLNRWVDRVRERRIGQA